MDPASLLAAEQVVSTTVEGAVVAGIGLAQATHPLSATFTRITSEAFLPRFNHSLTVVAGKAYLFGGEASPGELASDEIHIVRIPLTKSKGDGEPEYKCVPSLGAGENGEVPGPRSGHTACAVGGKLYVYGGRGKDLEPLEEKGRIWVFNTTTLHWSYLDSLTEFYPSARYHHSCVSSELPFSSINAPHTTTYTEQIKSAASKLPSLLSKATPSSEPHGTLIICGGHSSSSELLDDAYTFTIPSQSWSTLPSPPSPSGSPPALALANNTIYLISNTTSSADLGSEIHSLPLIRSTYKDARGENDLALTAKQDKWTTISFPTNPLAPGPRPRKGAGLIPVTTGHGREYLLYFLGEQASSPTSTETKTSEDHLFYSDTFSYQLPLPAMSAAGIKDATRSTLGIATGAETWAEVKVVASEEGKEGLEKEGKSHPGPRGWFGCAGLGKDVDGAGVVVWGGVNAKGEVEGEGWVVSVK